MSLFSVQFCFLCKARGGGKSNKVLEIVNIFFAVVETDGEFICNSVTSVYFLCKASERIPFTGVNELSA